MQRLSAARLHRVTRGQLAVERPSRRPTESSSSAPGAAFAHSTCKPPLGEGLRFSGSNGITFALRVGFFVGTDFEKSPEPSYASSCSVSTAVGKQAVAAREEKEEVLPPGMTSEDTPMTPAAPVVDERQKALDKYKERLLKHRCARGLACRSSV